MTTELNLNQDQTISEREQIRARVRSGLANADLNGYVGFTPSNVAYLSGYVSYFLSNWWRMQGTVFVAMDAGGTKSPQLVLSDAEVGSAEEAVSGCDVHSYPMWVETRGYADIQSEPPIGESPRPAQWRSEDLDEQLHEVLQATNLASGKVGTDLRFITQETYSRLMRVAPAVQWVDATDLIYSIRSVKSSFEVSRLRAAARLAEAGMLGAARRAEKGMTLTDIRALYFEAVARHARTEDGFDGFSDSWAIPGMGQHAGISSGSAGGGLSEGDLLKFDCGAIVDGYRSDSGRTFAFGAPAKDAVRLYGYLREAQERATALIRPGIRASQVYKEAASFMHSNGFPGYRRGHFGHSVGLDSFHEEPPFLAPGDETILEAGMVLAVETPFYGPDLGPIMIEDLVHVTDGGAEYLTLLPRTLQLTSEVGDAL